MLGKSQSSLVSTNTQRGYSKSKLTVFCMVRVQIQPDLHGALYPEFFQWIRYVSDVSPAPVELSICDGQTSSFICPLRTSVGTASFPASARQLHIPVEHDTCKGDVRP